MTKNHGLGLILWDSDKLLQKVLYSSYLRSPLGVKCLRISFWNVSRTKRMFSGRGQCESPGLNYAACFVSEVWLLCWSFTLGWFFIGNVQTDKQSCDRWSGLLPESGWVDEGWSPLPLHTNGSNISISASKACPSPVSEGDKTVWPLTILKQWCMCCQLGDCTGVRK